MAEAGLIYQEAIAAAEEIKTYAEAVRNAADELQELAQEAHQKGIRVTWCEQLLQKLNQYRENEIEAGLNEMITQANKILAMQNDIRVYETNGD